MNVATPTITRLPAIAFSRPPSLPGGGVICVNTLKLIAPTPFTSSVPRIHTSTPRPIAIASTDIASPTRLMTLRRAWMLMPDASYGRSRARPFAFGHAQQQQLRGSEHDQRDDEE